MSNIINLAYNDYNSECQVNNINEIMSNMSDNDEDYTNRSRMGCTYKGLEILTDRNSRDNIGVLGNEKYVNILCYKIIKSCSWGPFLVFCLHRRDKNDYGFERIYIDKIGISNNRSVGNIHRGEYKKDVGVSDIISTYEEGNKLNNLEYRGKILGENNEIFICLENLSEVLLENSLDICWALSSEIINDKEIIGKSINDSVVKFFEKYPSLLYLRDELGKLYESPAVGYYGGEEVGYVSTLGRNRESCREILGPYFYFDNFNKAMECALNASRKDSNDREINEGGEELDTIEALEALALPALQESDEGSIRRENSGLGIVRFALFLGKTTMKLNSPYDKNCRKTSSIIFKKLHDLDGEWTELYDSIQIGEPLSICFQDIDVNDRHYINKDNWISYFGSDEYFDIFDLDNNGEVSEEEWTKGITKIKERNIKVVKDYNQQLPLNYYLIEDMLE